MLDNKTVPIKCIHCGQTIGFLHKEETSSNLPIMATVNQFGRMIKVDLSMKKNTNDNMIIVYTTATVISQFLCKKCGECTSIKMQKIM